ncbi:6753_t:CDS:2 [Entrophospora sp. SA101]|nr:6753_t:CDS:2 [Entrophospora sp. SA101]
MNKINFSKITPQIGYYLAGFTDGEGSFHDKVILALFKKHLQCGSLRSRVDGVWYYEVNNFTAIVQNIIPFFRKYGFLSVKKKNDFAKFRQIAELIVRKDHLTKEGIKKILELREQMNNGGKHKYSTIRRNRYQIGRIFNRKNVNINLIIERSKGSETPCQSELYSDIKPNENLGFSMNKNLKLSSELREILVGKLLGDGHLETQTNVLTPPRIISKENNQNFGFQTISTGKLRFYGQQFYKNAVRELGLERRETVWSLSVVGAGNLRRSALMVIPVPIPNTEVKHYRGENTLYGEDSSLPLMAKIIFLNGCASAGKTTLAKEIQNLAKIVGFDKKAEESFQYVIDPQTGILTEMKASSYAIQVFSCLPKVVKLLADNGLNVIFDECNFVKKSEAEFLINDYKTLFSNHKFLMVGVKCDLATMEQREKLRGDRVIGMAKIFYQAEKSFHYPYDMIVDTTHESPFANAEKILQFLKEN